jgi:hypothetical protein
MSRTFSSTWFLVAAYLLAVLVTSAVGVLLILSAAVDGARVTRGGPTVPDELADVRLWLDEWWRTDGGGVLPCPTPFQAWIDHGRGIAGMEMKLLRLLPKEDELFRRARIIIALRFFGTAESVAALVTLLRTGDPYLQNEAAAALGGIGCPDAVEALCDATENHDVNVRGNACSALGCIGDPRATQCLRGALDDESSFVRDNAREALERLNEGR